MLKISITPNETGITIRGDYEDLYELNESIHDLLGNENAYEGYEGARIDISVFIKRQLIRIFMLQT